MVALAEESGDADISVPPTIQALLAARLDQLGAQERDVLQCGAVEGRIFHRGAVQALAPEEPQVSARLTALVRKELVRPDKPQLPGEDAFRFRHLLIRDAAYDALAKATRADLHERFAAWLEEHGRELVELDEILGYHLEQAFRYREELGSPDEEVGRWASGRLAAAGRRASNRGDEHAAVNLLLRAISLLPIAAPERLALVPLLQWPLYSTGRYEQAQQLFAETAETAARGGDVGAEGQARACLLLIGQATAPQGWPELAEREAERLAPLFESLGDERGLALVWELRVRVQWWRLQMAKLSEAFEQWTVHAQRSDLLAIQRLRANDASCARVRVDGRYGGYSQLRAAPGREHRGPGCQIRRACR